MTLEDKIRQRSYEIWLREGCREGRAMQNWLDAKAEIEREMNAKRRGAAFEYHTLPYRFDERQRIVVQPKPRISTPPQVRIANRITRELPPVAA